MGNRFEDDNYGDNNGWSDNFLVDFDEFIEKYVGRSLTNEYVIFSYCDDDSILVVDRGDLDYCFQRMKDIFDLAPVDGGLAMMCKERFDMLLED